MSAIRDGLRVATTIFEAAVWQHTIKVACRRCPNFSVFEAAGLWWHFERRGWDHQLKHASARFYCIYCAKSARQRIRPRPLQLVRDEPNRFLPPPPDRDWKRALSRFKT
jgi:hypothetical protein